MAHIVEGDLIHGDPPPPPEEDISEVVARLCDDRKLSPKQIDTLCTLSAGTTNKIKRGISSPGPEACQRIRDLDKVSTQFGTSVDTAGFYKFMIESHRPLGKRVPKDLLGLRGPMEDLIDFINSALSGDMA